MAIYILFDTETTGNQEEDRIIQVGAMVVQSNGQVEVYDELCSTTLPIKIEAMEVHGITPDLIENKPPFSQTKFAQILNQHNNNQNYLIAHNMPFDMGMLEKEGFVSNYTIIDTLRCAKHLYNNSPYHRLQYFRYSLELYKIEKEEAKKYNITIKAHDAIGDVLVMKLFLSKLVALTKEKFPGINPMVKLAQLSNEKIMLKTFKFGKYKGKNIEEVCDNDIGYINWLLDQKDLDTDLQYTLDKIMGHL
jgi:DNA polymerase III epsilon subunit-like protein